MECKKIFSYTKKSLKLSFLSFVLSISFSNKGVFAKPAYNAALPVESSTSASDSLVEYAYKSTSTTPDTDDDSASATYYTPNADGTAATAVVSKSNSYVFSKIQLIDAQSESESTSTKNLKVNKIIMNSNPPLNFSIFVLDATDKITIEPPTGEKNSILNVYLPTGVKPTAVFTDVAESDANVLALGTTKDGILFDKYSVSVKSVAQTSKTTESGSDSESLFSDEESDSSDSKSNSSDNSNNSNNSSSSSSTSNSSSNYSSSNYNSGYSSGSGFSSSASSTKSTTGTTKSSPSSSGSSSASKSASTKTFGSSFNPLFLLSGVCIPLFKKKKN